MLASSCISIKAGWLERGESTFEVSKQQIKRMSDMKLLGVREVAALLSFLAATWCRARCASS